MTDENPTCTRAKGFDINRIRKNYFGKQTPPKRKIRHRFVQVAFKKIRLVSVQKI